MSVKTEIKTKINLQESGANPDSFVFLANNLFIYKSKSNDFPQ